MAPVFGIAVEMSNGEYDDIFVLDDVNQTKGEASQPMPTHAFTQRVSCVRALGDQDHRGAHFRKEGFCNRNRTGRVPRMSILKFDFSRGEKLQVHDRSSLSSTLAKSAAAISPRR